MEFSEGGQTKEYKYSAWAAKSPRERAPPPLQQHTCARKFHVYAAVYQQGAAVMNIIKFVSPENATPAIGLVGSTPLSRIPGRSRVEMKKISKTDAGRMFPKPTL